MCCFSAEDTIFVLNKWDTIEDDEGKDEFFESAKTKLRTLWKEIDEKHILKLAAVKVSMHVHASMSKWLVHLIEHFFSMLAMISYSFAKKLNMQVQINGISELLW